MGSETARARQMARADGDGGARWDRWQNGEGNGETMMVTARVRERVPWTQE